MHYPKTVKRYNLELNLKKKRGSKLCLNNYTKTYTDEQVKLLLKSYLDKKIKLNYILQMLKIKRKRFFELLAKYRKDPDSFSIQYERKTINQKKSRYREKYYMYNFLCIIL